MGELEKRPEKKTIMIVDDDESMRLLIGSHLEKEYNLIFQEDGHEALIYLKENKVPDLILSDMEMPNLNGRVFLRRLKIGKQQLSKIPVIFITSVNARLMIKSTINHGAVGYIVKPFDPKELITQVKSVLEP